MPDAPCFVVLLVFVLFGAVLVSVIPGARVAVGCLFLVGGGWCVAPCSVGSGGKRVICPMGSSRGLVMC